MIEFTDELRLLPNERHIIADNLLNSVNPHVYLAWTLNDVGLQVRRKEVGPDFWIESDDGPIWIEATAPELGDQESPDVVPEPVAGRADYVPIREIVLRLTGAIHTKQMRFKKYAQNGLVDPDDRCVIALSAAKLRYPITTDYLQRAVYEAGDLYVALDRNTLRTVEQGRRHEPEAAKYGRKPFKKPSFVGTTCSHVSALLFGGRGIGNMPPIPGTDCALFHNRMATHPLSRGWLQRGSEHWIEADDDIVHLKSHQWND